MKNIVIIGAGIGGLTAGNLLARKGHKVTILEAHSTPGGYTAGFYRKGFYFESGTINLESSASVFKVMKEIGVLDKIDFVKLRTRFFSEDFDAIPESYEDYKRMIYTGFPADKEKLDTVFSELDEVVNLMGTNDKPLPLFYSGLGKVKSLLPYIVNAPKWIRLARRYGDMTSSEYAASYFDEGSKLFRLFKGFTYPDISPIALGPNIAGVINDVWAVKGGMQSWADVLADNFRQLGGELKLKACADRIITRNGTAVGVSCGSTVYDADCVISAMDYKKTFLELLDDKSLIPQKLKANIGSAAVSEGFFTVYLGLDMSNEELGGYMKVPHVFACDEAPGFDIYDSGDEGFFSKTSVSLYSSSMINPSLAPEGKSSLMLQAMVPYRWMNNWGGGDKELYRRLKEKSMNEIIENASKGIPGLKERIAYKDAATPLTYERFTRNTDGATSAWSWNPRKKFYGSPMDVKIDTPVKNLYIGSCWAMQIGGIPGALGAAYQCANRIK